MNELEELFQLQAEFQELILNNNLPKFRSETISNENIELIKNQILALYDEISEALRELPWKPWKSNQEFNVNKFRMELIDVFHFLINLFLLSGIDAQKTIALFKQKHTINRRRQRDGY